MAGQKFAPAVSLQQPVDGAVMHRVPDALLIGTLDFGGGQRLRTQTLQYFRDQVGHFRQAL
jgi:hypothetical protein